ncbi:PAS domain-containing protein, partial [Patescibacteria group bacterium]
MKISTRLQVTSIIYLVLILLVGTVVLVTSFYVRRENNDTQVANEIAFTIFEFDSNISTFILEGDEQALSKSYDHARDLTRLLAARDFNHLQEKNLISSISSRHLSVQKLLTQISNSPLSTTKDNSVIYSQILRENHIIVSEAIQLAEVSRQELDALQQLALIIAITFIGIFAIVLFVTVILNNTQVSVPLQQLQKTIKDVLSDGKLGTEVNIEVDNEIGELGKAFHEMSSKLKVSYDELEGKNEELTTHLGTSEERNKLLRETKMATLNILEDLQEEKQHLEKAKAKDDAILESIGDGLVATDGDTRVILVNSAFEKLTGRKREDVLGKPAATAVKAVDEYGEPIPYEKLPHLIALSSGKKVSTRRNLFYIHENGKHFPADVTVTPIISADET